MKNPNVRPEPTPNLEVIGEFVKNQEEEFVPMTPMQYRIVGGIVVLVIIALLKLLFPS